MSEETTKSISEFDDKNSETRKLLAERIRRCAELAGSGDLLAQKSGIPRRTLETYLSGAAEPKALRLAAIARVVNVSMDWLVTGKVPMKRKEPPPEPPANIQKQLLALYNEFIPRHPGPGQRERMQDFARMWNERNFAHYFSPDEINPELVRAIPDVTAEQIAAWRNIQEEGKRAKRREESRTSFDEVHGIKAPAITGQPTVQGVEEDDFVYVPRYETTANADLGTFGKERDRLAFRRDWMREMSLQPDRLALVEVSGDSMEPTLSVGDVVLVDLAQAEIRGDGIYVLRRDGTLIVKRLQTTITGDVYIRSDNDRYPPDHVPREKLGQVQVLGRIVWLGRRV
jgi:phage repressor protein C with HTH and peptisase S24 domain